MKKKQFVITALILATFLTGCGTTHKENTSEYTQNGIYNWTNGDVIYNDTSFHIPCTYEDIINAGYTEEEVAKDLEMIQAASYLMVSFKNSEGQTIDAFFDNTSKADEVHYKECMVREIGVNYRINKQNTCDIENVGLNTAPKVAMENLGEQYSYHEADGYYTVEYYNEDSTYIMNLLYSKTDNGISYTLENASVSYIGDLE